MSGPFTGIGTALLGIGYVVIGSIVVFAGACFIGLLVDASHFFRTGSALFKAMMEEYGIDPDGC